MQVAHPNQLITIAAVQQGTTPLLAGTRVTVIASVAGQVTVQTVS